MQAFLLPSAVSRQCLDVIGLELGFVKHRLNCLLITDPIFLYISIVVNYLFSYACLLQGVLYDLFECLYSYMDSANLSSIPIYFISPVADSSLAYSNIFAEWYEHFP